MFYTLYNIGWGLKRSQCVFDNNTAFCNKKLYTDKINCFINGKLNYNKLIKKKIGYGLFYKHKLTLLINQLTRK